MKHLNLRSLFWLGPLAFVLTIVLVLGAFFDMGSYLYRWLLLEKQTIQILVSEDPDLKGHLEKLKIQIERTYPNIEIEWSGMPPQRFLEAGDEPVPEVLSSVDLVWGSTVQGKKLMKAQLVDCSAAELLRESSDPGLQARLVEGAGPLCGVPLYFADYLLVYYNKSILPTMPSDPAEFFQKLAAFRDPAQERFGLGIGEDAYSFLSFIGGKDYFMPMADKTQRLTEAFEQAGDLAFGQDLTPRRCYEDCLLKMFEEARVPLIVAGEWQMTHLKARLGDRLGVSSLAALTAVGIPLKTPYDGRFLFKLKSSPKPKQQAVQEVLEYFASAEAQGRLADEMQKVPAHPSLIDQSRVSASASYGFEWGAVRQSFLDLSPESRQQTLASLELVLPRWKRGELLSSEASQQFHQSQAK